MTSQDVGQLTKNFLSQMRGLFAGLEKLPLAFEELERREQELPAMADRVKDLGQQIAQQTQALAQVEAQVRTKREQAQAQQQKVMVSALASLHGQITDEEATLAGVKAELDAVSQELREKKTLLASFKA